MLRLICITYLRRSDRFENEGEAEGVDSEREEAELQERYTSRDESFRETGKFVFVFVLFSSVRLYSYYRDRRYKLSELIICVRCCKCKPTPFCVLGQLNGCPVFSHTKKGLKIKQILDICLSENVPEGRVCQNVPTEVKRSAVFVVNLEAVDEMDLTTDDCGIYGSHSSPNEEVDVLLEDRGEVSDFVTLRGRTAEATGSPCPGWERVTVRRQYSWHSQTKDYKRIIIKVVHKEELLRLAIVQYQVNIPETDLIFQKPHANRQVRIEPHVRTKPSLLNRMRSMGSNHSLKHAIQELEKKAGGLSGISSPSEIPRDRQQVYNQFRKVKGHVKSRSTGPSKAPEVTKLLAMQQGGDFLKDVKFSARDDGRGGKKEAANTFAASDNCLNWMRRFCKGHNATSVAGIDMTYKLGPFYLTTLTFPNPIFVQKNGCFQAPHNLGGYYDIGDQSRGRLRILR